jgi:multidrug efflux system membrane fusion protein
MMTKKTADHFLQESGTVSGLAASGLIGTLPDSARLLQTYLLILVLLAAGSAAGCSQARAYEKPLTPVRAQAAQSLNPSGEEGGGSHYSATIKPGMQLDLSFKSGGYISELLQVRGADGRMRSVQEGDLVKRGTIFARLRETDFATRAQGAEAQVAEAQAMLGTSKAQLAEAESGMRQSQRDFERATSLLESNSITKPEHDAAGTRLEMAQAKVAAAQAQVQVIQAKINSAKTALAVAQTAKSDAALRAPIDCVVLRRTVEQGSLVMAGSPVITLAEAGSVKAVFGVPDLMVQSLAQGKELKLTTEAIPGVEFGGLVTRISAVADPKTRVFDVEVTIPRPPTQLRAGMIASLIVPDSPDFNAVSTPVTAVPLAAIVRSPDNPDGYAVNVVIDEGGKQIARRRAVRLGEAYGNLIGVTEGLQVGEQVIVEGASVVVDGEQIRITH